MKGASNVVDPSISEDDDTFNSIVSDEIIRKRDRLLNNILSGSTKSLIEKVAHILNLYPKSRDSDLNLAVNFVRTFHTNIIDDDDKIKLSDLYNIPKFYDMQRYRAKIQNEYKLFLASKEVRQFRKEKANDKAEEFIRSTRDTEPIVVFADESGKNSEFYIIGSIWIHNRYNYMNLVQRCSQWRKDEDYSSEMHFSTLKDINKIPKFVNFFINAIRDGEFCSLIALVIKNKDIDKSRKDIFLYEAYKEMILSGIESEIIHGRMENIYSITLHKDKDGISDEIYLRDMTRKLDKDIKDFFNNQAQINRIYSVSSKDNDIIQLSDIFSGVVNRWINSEDKPSPIGNTKSKLSFLIGEMLGLHFDEHNKLRCVPDFCKILYLDE